MLWKVSWYFASSFKVNKPQDCIILVLLTGALIETKARKRSHRLSIMLITPTFLAQSLRSLRQAYKICSFYVSRELSLFCAKRTYFERMRQEWVENISTLSRIRITLTHENIYMTIGKSILIYCIYIVMAYSPYILYCSPNISSSYVIR